MASSLQSWGEILRTQNLSSERRMDLVSREEFDVQAAVLARTREKLTALEDKVAELEHAVDGNPTSGDPATRS